MEAYLVEYFDYDDVRMDSIWTDEFDALKRCEELGNGNWMVTSLPLNAPGDPTGPWGTP